MTADKRICEISSWLDNLQSLLEKQIQLIRRGDINDIEQLSSKTGAVLEKVAAAGVFRSEKFKSQRGHLAKLYKDMSLAVAVEKARVLEELGKVRKSKKTLGTYHRNI